ncbi:MAG: iron-containing alcohol dehydrogenase [Bacteroidota bacterium]|jgi:alcohol dehydrogenase class IV|nr:MAG: alcohol dehydrogenase [Bacteroidota bacterium]
MTTQPILQFNFPTTIRFGVGASAELGDYLKRSGVTKPLIVTDSTVAELEFFRNITNELTRKGISVEVFSAIHKNPVRSDVYAGTIVYDATMRDGIVGIGGGAALDVARAIALRVNHRDDLFKYDDLVGGEVYITGEIPHLVTIPTTSGTGSEVGRSAIISEDTTHQKRILFSPKLIARMVFADPALTFDLPPAVTAATGMDALTHNLEAYLAKMYHPICEGVALEGISLISQAIERAVHHPDLDSRSMMMMGSIMGGIAFQKGLGVVHSLAHPLSTLLDVHHGLANAINLPHGMEFNRDGFEWKFERIAQALRLQSNDTAAVIRYLADLNDAIGVPPRLRDIGVKEEHLDALADLAIADFAHPNNPKSVTREDFRALYEKAF